VHTLAPALAELTAREWDHGTEHSSHHLPVSKPHAHRCPTSFPGELKARFNLPTHRWQTLEQLKTTVEEILRRHRVRYTLEWYVSGEPFLHPPGCCARGG